MSVLAEYMLVKNCNTALTPLGHVCNTTLPPAIPPYRPFVSPCNTAPTAPSLSPCNTTLPASQRLFAILLTLPPTLIPLPASRCRSASAAPSLSPCNTILPTGQRLFEILPRPSPHCQLPAVGQRLLPLHFRLAIPPFPPVSAFLQYSPDPHPAASFPPLVSVYRPFTFALQYNPSRRSAPFCNTSLTLIPLPASRRRSASTAPSLSPCNTTLPTSQRLFAILP